LSVLYVLSTAESTQRKAAELKTPDGRSWRISFFQLSDFISGQQTVAPTPWGTEGDVSHNLTNGWARGAPWANKKLAKL